MKLDVDDERDLIEGIYIPAAREDCEDFHGWSYVERTLEYVIDRWPSGDRIYLPRPPVQEILSVYYLDKDGNEVVFDDWLPSLDGDPMVVLKPGCSWPTAALYPAGAVRVRYVSGYPAKESEIQHTGEEVGTGDDEETEFTLKNIPVKEGSVTIYLDGAGTADYTLNRETGQIVFNEPPGEDVSITADYRSNRPLRQYTLRRQSGHPADNRKLRREPGSRGRAWSYPAENPRHGGGSVVENPLLLA